MAEVEATIYDSGPVLIRFKGDFLFNKLYNGIKKWYKANRLKLYETKYKDKTTDGERLIQVKLHGNLKTTEYYKHTVDVEIFTEHYFERQLQVNGKKEVMGNGKIFVKINGTVIADHKGLFEVESKRSWITKLYKGMGKLLFSIRKNEFIMKEAGVLAGELETLSNNIKHILNMQSKV